jgi:uncharacterized membrane protein
MFWIILGIVCLILLVTGILMNRFGSYCDDTGLAMSAISGSILFFVVMIMLIFKIVDGRAINSFEQQKEYIENHEPVNDIEDAALTTKKVELNEWLYGAQYSKKNYGIFTLLPDEILKMKPIE